ncbi:MAG: hypothetical protein KME07_17400 [Pegethrix bostrychoides GSE-TBD4-15B]|jgi:hypothetical protein|uniref:Uncharacterized protein n=1 Tax=Pegethrix bostrychoides GSE-TBD4-15B TaxID=2839662 RepID=A0A951U628_9CYAN|nr:hypothetical protein [Pegethrix bostrychoides GSE-TBD4-15B]
MNRWQSLKQVRQALKQLWKRLPASALAVLMAASFMLGSAGCSRSGEGSGVMAFAPQRSRLSEVSPPFTIQALKQSLEANQPQVSILSPKSGQVVEKTQVDVKLQVKDLDLYKDEDLGLGLYLQVLLDSQPYAQIYDANQTLTLENLAPGTHTLRAFAVRPWHESFKNDGAFVQTTFHIFAKTPENNPDASQPLLTYNYPQGVYGAEPVLLDFLLTNAPLHLVAREDDKDDIPDWQVRCTINGESFTFDRWEPIYLKGFKPGTNWVQLELLDEKGDPLPNAFNNAVQLVTYEPGGSDTLARLTRGELTAEDARKIVDPNYLPPVIAPEPEVAEPEMIKAEPEVTEPEVIEPDIIEAEPEITEPEITEPEITEPEPEAILEPDLTEELAPEDMPPEVIEPAPIDSAAPAAPAPDLLPDLEAPTPSADLPEELPEPNESDDLPPAAPSPKQFLPTPLNPDAISPVPLTDLTPEAVKPAPVKPAMIGALDQVKGFFESLRKQPAEAASSYSLPSSNMSGASLEEPTIIDTLMESLPDSLRKPLMEELLNETATASPASPD